MALTHMLNAIFKHFKWTTPKKFHPAAISLKFNNPIALKY